MLDLRDNGLTLPDAEALAAVLVVNRTLAKVALSPRDARGTGRSSRSRAFE